MPKMMQCSFASGEISPVLQARVDLARYATGLAEVKNMIVLPEGGVTRRGGFSRITPALASLGMMIPFEYNSTDNVMLEFGHKAIRVISMSGEIYAALDSPYELSQVRKIRYVQSGNVIFLAHREHKPMMLARKSKTSWELSELSYRGGPWIDGADWNSDVTLKMSGGGNTIAVQSLGAGIFTTGVVGSYIKLEYPLSAASETFQSKATSSWETGYSKDYEVKGSLNVETSGEWTGVIGVERSIDGGATWVTVKEYHRQNHRTQGQWDFTLSEAEDYVFYRVYARHLPMKNEEAVDTGEWPIWAADTAMGSNEPATVTVSVPGFIKAGIYRIKSRSGNSGATLERQGEDVIAANGYYSGQVSSWSMGAWGTEQGYPGAVAMYQDRLVFAGSKLQPTTIWMSRTGDYADYSTSSDVRDDDAVNITLAGAKADRIHSLCTTTDLLAFTTGGEWRIRGAGDAGAITPTAIVAHEQTNIGTKEIQPIQINGRVILVQRDGAKVYALGYDLNTDGYSGSELSIMSGHIFKGKEITGMTYQQTPNSLLWFVLSDHTCAVCTYNPEHEVIGWSRHAVRGGVMSVCSVGHELFATAFSGSGYILMKQEDGKYLDDNISYDSEIKTLRLSRDGGEYTTKKLISRVIVSALDSSEAWAYPEDWERRRKVRWEGSGLRDADIQLDNGFDAYACVSIRSEGSKALTIAAITPIVTGGG